MSLSSAIEKERLDIIRNLDNSKDAWSSTDEETRQKRKKKSNRNSTGMPGQIEALLRESENERRGRRASIGGPIAEDDVSTASSTRRSFDDNDAEPKSAAPRIQFARDTKPAPDKSSSSEGASGRPRSAMAAVFGDGDIPRPKLDTGDRSASPTGSGPRNSQSPASRLFRSGGRSSSPLSKALSRRSLGLSPDGSNDSLRTPSSPTKRRYSEGVPARPNSPVVTSALRKVSDPGPDDEDSERLKEDYEVGSEAVSSDEESDDDERELSPESGRGRRRSRTKKDSQDDDDSPLSSPPNNKFKGRLGRPQNYSNSSPLDSLRDLTVTVTTPDGERAAHSKRSSVHPMTSFDQGGDSNLPTPMNSDEEQDLRDIKRAQRLPLTVSQIHSTPEAHRVIRQTIRGDYAGLAKEAQAGLRRQRVYLVATDLSEEAAYAMEWTIGTVLRDGDTLLAVYAVDEETGTGGGETSSVGIGEGASAVRDTASISASLSKTQEATRILSTGPSPLSAGDIPDLAGMSKSERERYQAVQMITERCVKLLRKTRLQIRVIVEVFHCKSPKHMITEVIDYLDPTLVVLGSRGRSALKGVLLGSFSNYLVTKSSVPVMVARRRLRKHHKRPPVRLSNMLIDPHTQSASRFKNAKVDEMMDPAFQRRKRREEKQLQEALALIPR